jgi:hypothetical protein
MLGFEAQTSKHSSNGFEVQTMKQYIPKFDDQSNKPSCMPYQA